MAEGEWRIRKVLLLKMKRLSYGPILCSHTLIIYSKATCDEVSLYNEIDTTLSIQCVPVQLNAVYKV